MKSSQELQPTSLKFLTLNCWGLPFLTPQRKRRFRAITDILKSADWDVVALQEVWLKGDRQWLIENSGFEFHATFDSDKRFLGSGLLLLSRYKILKRDFHAFIARGFPHKIQEFDFHSSKGIGYALIDTPRGEVPVFLTHLIAKYVPRNTHDTNRLFRMAQILELVFYVRQMATPRGFVLCGDLNSTEDDLEIETLSALFGVHRFPGPKLKSEKKRLDYILCGATLHDVEFKVSRSRFVFKDSIAGESLPYSDHHGVSAVVRWAKFASDNTSNRRILARTLRYMKHSVKHVNQVVKKIKWIPILGWISQYFLKPQLTYIQALITMLETDLKEAESNHPLRLKDIG